MKKMITLLLVAFSFAGLQAQVWLDETFNYSTTTLASQNGDPNAGVDNNAIGTWYRAFRTDLSNSGSFTMNSDPLYYEGYISSDKGKSVRIDNGGNPDNTRVDIVYFLPCTPETIIKEGTVYYAFMMSVDDFKTWAGGVENNEWRDIFITCDGTGDNPGQRIRGRFFIRQEGSQLEYTISKNTGYEKMDGTQPVNKGSVGIGEVNLFVIKQTFTGGADCKIEVIANPVIGETEPTSGWINGNPGDSNTFNGVYGIGFRRRPIANSAGLSIGGLRIARSWGEVLGLGSAGLPSVSVNEFIYANEKTIIAGKPGFIKVFNLVGQEVLSSAIKGQLETGLAAGTYIVHFTDEAGKIISGKVLMK